MEVMAVETIVALDISCELEVQDRLHQCGQTEGHKCNIGFISVVRLRGTSAT